jgi:hypothetical protein
MSLADSHTSTHVSPNLWRAVVMVEMDGLHANGVILKP